MSTTFRTSTSAFRVPQHQRTTEVHIEPAKMEQMTDCMDPEEVAKAKHLWTQIRAEDVGDMRKNEGFVCGSAAFGTEDQDWASSSTQMLRKLTCLLRNEFATVERCGQELQCAAKEYECAAKQAKDCQKRLDDARKASSSSRDACCVRDLKASIAQARCDMAACEKRARECRKQIREARGEIAKLAGKDGFSMDGSVETLTGQNNIIAVKQNGDQTYADVTINKAAFGNMLKKGYLPDLFTALLCIRIVENERRFFQAVREMRLRAIVAENECAMAGEEDADGPCPYDCECSCASASSATAFRVASLSQSVYCKCGAASRWKKECEERAKRRQELREDPAKAFLLKDEDVYEYICVKIFGQDEKKFKEQQKAAKEARELAKREGKDLTEVAKLADGSAGGAADNVLALSRMQFPHFLYTSIMGGEVEIAKKSTKDKAEGTNSLDIFKNIKNLANQVQASTGSCACLSPQKIMAECVLSTCRSGMFAGCCHEGQQLFEEVYCDANTGSIALVCQFVSDMLLASRCVKITGKEAGIYYTTGRAKTILHSADPNDETSNVMRISGPEDGIDLAPNEIKDYHKNLAEALVEQIDKAFSAYGLNCLTYRQEVAHNANFGLSMIAGLVPMAIQISNIEFKHLLTKQDLQLIASYKTHRLLQTKNTKSGYDEYPLRSQEKASKAGLVFFDSLGDKSFYKSLDDTQKKTLNNADPKSDDKFGYFANVYLRMSLLYQVLPTKPDNTKELALLASCYIQTTDNKNEMRLKAYLADKNNMDPETAGTNDRTDYTTDEKQVYAGFTIRKDSAGNDINAAAFKNLLTDASTDAEIYFLSLSEENQKKVNQEYTKNFPPSVKEYVQKTTVKYTAFKKNVLMGYSADKKQDQTPDDEVIDFFEVDSVPEAEAGKSSETSEEQPDAPEEAASPPVETRKEPSSEPEENPENSEENKDEKTMAGNSSAALGVTGGIQNAIADSLDTEERESHVVHHVLCNIDQYSCEADLFESDHGSEEQSAKNEQSAKLMHSFLEMLVKFCAPNQQWGTMAQALHEVAQSLEC